MAGCFLEGKKWTLTSSLLNYLTWLYTEMKKKKEANHSYVC